MFTFAPMEQTLVLNATYEPLRIVPWQKAITLLFQGKVEVIAVYDREIRGVTVRVRLPSGARHRGFAGRRHRERAMGSAAVVGPLGILARQ